MRTKTYCGVDFHKNQTEICVKDESGKVIERARIATNKVELYFKNKPEMWIAIEASGGVFDACEKLKRLGHRVRMVHPGKFRAIGYGGKKTDKRDAEMLAEALRLDAIPEVYQKSRYARELKSLLASRDLAVSLRTSIVSHVRGILREWGLPMPQGMQEFREHVAKTLEELENPLIAKILRSLTDEIAALLEKEKEIEAALDELAGEDERVHRLTAVPGVGKLTALAFVAAVEDPKRFKDAKHLGAYLGLTPRESSSGNKRRLGGITKAGPEMVRRYLVHGARAALRHESSPEHKQRVWAEKLEKKIGIHKATVALAHKNAKILYAMLRNNTCYNERKKVLKNLAA
jgi:transposase